MKARRKARCTVLQALYEIDCTKHTVADVMVHRLEEDPLPEAGREFAYDMVNGVLAHCDRMDVVIQRGGGTRQAFWLRQRSALYHRRVGSAGSPP